MRGWWLAVGLVALAGCEEPVDYCAVEGEKAEACNQPIDVENCRLRTNRCRVGDGAVLAAFSDCLDAAGYGVCGACIIEEIPRICTADAAAEDQAAVDTCTAQLREDLSNPCDNQLFRSCSTDFPEGAAMLLLPIGWMLRRRRGVSGAR